MGTGRNRGGARERRREGESGVALGPVALYLTDAREKPAAFVWCFVRVASVERVSQQYFFSDTPFVTKLDFLSLPNLAQNQFCLFSFLARLF
jgi:hypothetical protein